MSHLSESVLRRYIDEPDALLSYEKAHLLQCNACRSRLEQLRERAAFAASHLTVNGQINVASAQRSVFARSPGVADPRPVTTLRGVPSRTLQWSGALAAALALFLILGYSPLRGYAQNFLAIFEPHQFAPIGFTSSDLTKMRGLPNLKAFGSMRESGSAKFSNFGSDLAAARVFTHMAALRANYLPAGVPNRVTYHASGSHTVSFRFKSTAAHPVPSTIDGSTISATLGPILIETYGEPPSLMQKFGHKNGMHNLPSDTIVITEARAPKVYSTGATVAQIESWLLAQPGLSANVVQQIKAIGDPSTTLPVPFQLDKQSAQNVTIANAPGILIGDNTGVGSFVMWQADGSVYAVAGPYAASEILRVANSLAQ